MLQFGEYTIAWFAYIVAIIGLLVVAYRLFRGIPWRYLRHFIVVTIAAILLTPAIGLEDYWAPAWIIGSLELLFGGLESALPAGRIILIVSFASLLLYTLIHLVFFRGRKASQGDSSEKGSSNSDSSTHGTSKTNATKKGATKTNSHPASSESSQHRPNISPRTS